MILSRRFFTVAWPAVLLCLAGVIDTMFVWSGLVLLAVLVLASILDYVNCPSVSRFSVRRFAPRRLALGVANTVSIGVELRFPRRLRITLRDEPPDEWEMRDVVFQDWIQPRHVKTWTYTVTPPRRGDYYFHDFNLACRGPVFGLIEKRYVIAASMPARVYPNYHEIRKFSLLAQRHKLNEIGLRPISRYGEGTEFESLRDYTPDDDYRRIDWKASARTVRLITRQHQVERSQHIMLIVDCGRLMGTIGGAASRLDHAVDAALMLAYLALRQDDQVGLLVYDERVRRHLAPRRHRMQLGQILENLYALKSDLVESNYVEAFEYFRKKQKRRSLAVIFTEVIDRRASQLLIRSVQSLYPRHLPLVVLMRDCALDAVIRHPAHEAFDRFRKAAASEILMEREEAVSDLRSHGVTVLDVLPEHLTVTLLNQYIVVKSRGRL